MNIQDWFPLGWTGWISLQSKGLSRVFSNTTVQRYQFFSAELSFMVRLSYLYVTTGKTIALIRWTFVGKVMSLSFNMLPRLVIAFLLRSKHLLISRLQSLSTVILETKTIKSIGNGHQFPNLNLFRSISQIETSIQFQLQILGEELRWPSLCQQPPQGCSQYNPGMWLGRASSQKRGERGRGNNEDLSWEAREGNLWWLTAEVCLGLSWI